MSPTAEFNYQAWWAEQLAPFDCDAATTEEVELLVNEQGVEKFPAAYEGFLLVAGRRCGSLWIGTDAFYPAIVGLREDAIELLDDGDAEKRLEANDVVIGMHQGYNFLFLSGEIVRIAEHFTELVLSALQETSER